MEAEMLSNGTLLENFIPLTIKCFKCRVSVLKNETF